MNNDNIIRDRLIKAGVKNLKEFGYPDVTENNILEVEVYRIFFERMLKDEENYGKMKRIDRVIETLLEEIKEKE